MEEDMDDDQTMKDDGVRIEVEGWQRIVFQERYLDTPEAL